MSAIEEQTSRTLSVPKFLHEVHGERTTVLALVMTYLAGAIGALLAGFVLFDAGRPFWQAAVAGVIFFDVAGGVVSNFSPGTRAFYRQSLRRRRVFLMLHPIQPAVMAFLLPVDLWFYAAVAVAVPAGAWLLLKIKTTADQRLVASALVVIAAMLALLFASQPLAQAFGFLFTVKLWLAFAVNQTSDTLEGEGPAA